MPNILEVQMPRSKNNLWNVGQFDFDSSTQRTHEHRFDSSRYIPSKNYQLMLRLVKYFQANECFQFFRLAGDQLTDHFLFLIGGGPVDWTSILFWDQLNEQLCSLYWWPRLNWNICVCCSWNIYTLSSFLCARNIFSLSNNIISNLKTWRKAQQ